MFFDYYLLLAIAFAMMLDIIFGDADVIYSRVPHPVVLMGRLFGFADERFNKAGAGSTKQILYGGFFVLLISVFCAFLAWVLGSFGFIVEVIIASIFLAQNSLYRHVRAVEKKLAEGNLPLAKTALKKLVSRDTKRLDKHGVGRAAIESLAENFSDAVVAPIFWFLIGGLPGLVFYKAVNTADSMWGYRNKKYESFGKVAARLDDIMNFIPARLSILPLFIIALVLPRSNVKQLFRVISDDAGKHKSVNAGYPEAGFAGVLNLSLGGDRYYEDTGENDIWIGDGKQEVTHRDISSALAVYSYAICIILAFILGFVL